jgi:exodeoxyribonuclease V alpha subunit
MKKDVHLQFANFFTTDTNLASFLYVLSQKMSEGHICINVKDPIVDDVRASLNIDSNIPFTSDVAIIGSPSDNLKPFILDGDLLYTQRNYKYEVTLAQKIQELLHAGNNNFNMETLKSIFSKYFDVHKESQEIDWQLVAAFAALRQNFCVITGGPGTGKTTTVSKILAIMLESNSNLKIAMAAPTGKASARMAESLKHASNYLEPTIQRLFSDFKPTTIHRLLGSLPNSIYFKYNHTNPLDVDVVIIDECSMIDISLFAKLLSAIPPHATLILLGDQYQLSSVEAGSVFGDICDAANGGNLFSARFHSHLNELLGNKYNLNIKEKNDYELQDVVVALTKSHRFKDDEGIGVLSKAILNNDVALIENLWLWKGNNQVELDDTYSETLKYKFYDNFKHYILDKDGNNLQPLDALKQFSYCGVLALTKASDKGVLSINAEIERYLQAKNFIDLSEKWYTYRPIMITKNLYHLGLYNGDIGITFKDDDDVQKVFFLQKDADGNEVIKKVIPSLISDCETCFAMTIHKSQGSEFDNVMMVIPELGSKELLTKELVYTGLTRAKKYAFIQCNKSVFMEACSKTVARYSGLKNRLKKSSISEV